MTKLEDKIKAAAEGAIVESITKGGWIVSDYANRISIPKDIMSEVWAMVDRDKLKANLKERVERDLADRIVNQLAAEMATDVKKILSVPERREALRALARDHIKSIMGVDA
jgi:hypothetical protein